MLNFLLYVNSKKNDITIKNKTVNDGIEKYVNIENILSIFKKYLNVLNFKKIKNNTKKTISIFYKDSYNKLNCFFIKKIKLTKYLPKNYMISKLSKQKHKTQKYLDSGDLNKKIDQNNTIFIIKINNLITKFNKKLQIKINPIMHQNKVKNNIEHILSFYSINKLLNKNLNSNNIKISKIKIYTLKNKLFKKHVIMGKVINQFKNNKKVIIPTKNLNNFKKSEKINNIFKIINKKIIWVIKKEKIQNILNNLNTVYKKNIKNKLYKINIKKIETLIKTQINNINIYDCNSKKKFLKNKKIIELKLKKTIISNIIDNLILQIKYVNNLKINKTINFKVFDSKLLKTYIKNFQEIYKKYNETINKSETIIKKYMLNLIK